MEEKEVYPEYLRYTTHRLPLHMSPYILDISMSDLNKGEVLPIKYKTQKEEWRIQ